MDNPNRTIVNDAGPYDSILGNPTPIAGLNHDRIDILLSIVERVVGHPSLGGIKEAALAELQVISNKLTEALANKRLQDKKLADEAAAKKVADEKAQQKAQDEALHRPAPNPNSVGSTGPGPLFVRQPSPGGPNV